MRGAQGGGGGEVLATERRWGGVHVDVCVSARALRRVSVLSAAPVAVCRAHGVSGLIGVEAR